MATYTLIIKLADTEYDALKEGGYSLYVAKKVNDGYIYIAQEGFFLANHKVQWVEKYQVSGQIKAKGDIMTNTVPIQYGQTCTLDITGKMNPATGLPTGGSFDVANDCSPVKIKVENLVGTTWTPLYEDLTPIVAGSTTFTPAVTVFVWFERNIETPTMVSNAKSKSIKVNLKGKTSAIISYSSDNAQGKSIWNIEDENALSDLQDVNGKVYQPMSDIFKNLPFPEDPPMPHDGFVTKYLPPAPEFHVKAVITFDTPSDTDDISRFITHGLLPPNIYPFIEPREDKKSIVVKIAWKPENSAHNNNDTEQLKEEFKNAISTLKRKELNFVDLDLAPGPKSPSEHGDLAPISNNPSELHLDEGSSPMLKDLSEIEAPAPGSSGEHEDSLPILKDSNEHENSATSPEVPNENEGPDVSSNSPNEAQT